MRFLLDTHIVLWTLTASPRIANMQSLILSEETTAFVSVVSWWELATKIAIGKLDADLPTLRQAAKDSGFFELTVRGEHTEGLVNLPLLHRDPFDRMLVAQAMAEPMKLITADAILAQYTNLVSLI